MQKFLEAESFSSIELKAAETVRTTEVLLLDYPMTRIFCW